MKDRKNEDGYAMILVLLLIVFITIASAIFMRASISNAKQERVVDTNNLAVVAAEMGVDYFNAAVTNEYHRQKEGLLLAAQNEINALVASDAYKNMNENRRKFEIDEIKKKLADNLKENLEIALNSSDHSKEISEDGILKFELVSPKIVSTKDLVEVKGEVHGIHDEGKEQILELNMIFNLPGIVNPDSGNEGNESPVPPPNDEVVVIEGDYQIKRGVNPDVKKSIKIKQNLTSEPGDHYTSIFFNNNLTVNGRIEINNHACIVIGKSFNLKGGSKLGPDVYLFIYGDMHSPAELDENPNTKVFVTGSEYINGVKQIPKKYPPVPDSSIHLDCHLPGKLDQGDLIAPSLKDKWPPVEINVEYTR